MPNDKIISINGFKLGLDKRKAEITAVPGALTTLRDGFVNQGGEIEKRKAFERAYNVSTLDSLGDTGTFGYEVTSAGHTVFGSAIVFGGSVTLSQPTLLAAMPAGVTYQQLKHPAITELQTYDRTKHRITAFVHSHNFGGFAWVVVTFADGKTFTYYNGSIIWDFASGLILAHLAGNTDANRDLIATHLINRVNETGVFTATDPSGAGNLDIASPVGSPYLLTITEDSPLGAITQSDQSDEIPPVLGVSSVSSFRVVGGSAGAKATGTLTSDATAPSDGDTVTIGSTVYTFKTALSAGPTIAYEVLIGASAAVALDNLKAAINDTGVEGTNYSVGTVAHPTVEATTNTDTTQVVQALVGGTGGNVASLENSTHLAWGGSALTGGTDPNYISAIHVGPIGGPFTNIIDSNVAWRTSDEATATAIVAEINSVSSGFTAQAIGDVVKISGATAQGDAYNNWVTKTTAAGNFCVGNLSLLFSASTTAFAVNSFLADGTSLVSGAPHTLSTTVEALVAAVSADINDATGTHGYLSCPRGKFLLLSKALSSSEDPPVDVYVGVTNGGVIATEEEPPELIVSLSTSSYSNQTTENEVTTPVFTCLISSGGTYTFAWRELPVNGISQIKVFGGSLAILAANQQSTAFKLNLSTSITRLIVTDFVCDVTDSFGRVVTSPVLRVTIRFARN